MNTPHFLRTRLQISPPSLPSEALLNEVHHFDILHRANSLSDVIREPTWSTDCHAHGARLLLDLILQQDIDLRSAGEHLDGRAGRYDVSCVVWSRDKKLDSQDLSPPRHLQYEIHPFSHPFKVLGFADDPHQSDLACGHGVVVEALNEVSDVRDLVSDATGACEEDYMSVRVERMMSGVGAFKRSTDSKMPGLT